MTTDKDMIESASTIRDMMKENQELRDERDTLAAQVEVLREGLKKTGNVLLGILSELQGQPIECLGRAGDGYNQWPIRDEMIDDAKKGRANITATLAKADTMKGAGND